MSHVHVDTTESPTGTRSLENPAVAAVKSPRPAPGSGLVPPCDSTDGVVLSPLRTHQSQLSRDVVLAKLVSPGAPAGGPVQHPLSRRRRADVDMTAIQGMDGIGYKQFADPRILEASKRALMRQMSEPSCAGASLESRRGSTVEGDARRPSVARSILSAERSVSVSSRGADSTAAVAASSSASGGIVHDEEDALPSPETMDIRAARIRLENSRLRKWRDMLLHWDYYRRNSPDKIKSRCRKGIPDAVRAQAWAALLGIPPAGGASRYIGGSIHPAYDQNVSVVLPRVSTRVGALAGAGSIPGGYGGRAGAGRAGDPARSSLGAVGAASGAGGSIMDRTIPGASEGPGSGSTDGDKGPPGQPPPIDPDILRKGPGLPHYARLLARGPRSGKEVLSPGAVIDVDIARTYPHQPLFHAPRESTSGGDGQTALRNILRAYAALDPHVGYCQGMAFLAAMLLSYMPEQRAFVAFVGLMAQPPTRMADMFTHDLGMVRVKQHQLRKGIAKCIPRIHEALTRHNVDESMWATHWVLTALSHSFPFAVVARLWDAFLCEGWKAVLRFCLAILSAFAPEITGSDSFEELMGVLGSLPQLLRTRLDNPDSGTGGSGGDPAGNLTVDSLAELAWSMPLVRSELAVWEKEGIEELEAQRRKDRARRAVADSKRAARAAARAKEKEKDEKRAALGATAGAAGGGGGRGAGGVASVGGIGGAAAASSGGGSAGPVLSIRAAREGSAGVK